jgi:hypothetical protein
MTITKRNKIIIVRIIAFPNCTNSGCKEKYLSAILNIEETDTDTNDYLTEISYA